MTPARMAKGAGVRCRAQLSRAAQFARSNGLAPTRAERFARRCGDEDFPAPTLDELARWPEWPGLPAPERTRIFALAAVLGARDALAEVISGPDLRRYAEPFGDDLFDRAMGMGGGGTRPLPAPEQLAFAGEALACDGLPPALARHFGQPSANDAEAARHVAEAERLLGPALVAAA